MRGSAAMHHRHFVLVIVAKTTIVTAPHPNFKSQPLEPGLDPRLCIYTLRLTLTLDDRHPFRTDFLMYMQSVRDGDGKEVSLAQFAGKVAVVVNVASQCGYTEANYKGLTKLYKKFRDQGLVVCA